MVLAAWYSNLLELGTLYQWLPKQMNVIRTKAWLVNSAWSWKNSKLKQIISLNLVFLTNPVWEHTEVPHGFASSLVLYKDQQLGIPSPHANTLLYPFNNNIMPRCHITTTSLPTLLCKALVMSCSFGRKLMCPCSEHVHLCDHAQTISMGLEILTLGVHFDI